MLRPITHVLDLISYSIRTLGPATIARASVDWMRDTDARNVDSGFDRRYGTDTNGVLTPTAAGLPKSRRRLATMYVPSMDSDLEALLFALPWPPALTAASTFVDIGSGKGRVVLLAAMQRFREVIGIELSPQLHSIALQNLEIMNAIHTLCSPVSFRHEDASAFRPPDGPLIIYMYHPFPAPIASAVLGRIRASLKSTPRPATILYCHPTLQLPIERELFQEENVFRLHTTGERRTKKFKIGWSVYANDEWLASRRPSEEDCALLPAAA